MAYGFHCDVNLCSQSYDLIITPPLDPSSPFAESFHCYANITSANWLRHLISS